MHKWHFFCRMILALCLGLFSALAQASQASLCEDSAQFASKDTGVPLSVLRAVALAETGQTKFDKNDYSAWPWTVQSGQKGHWFPDKSTAIQFVQSLMAAQTTNIDIGCFQINIRWHGQAFQNLEDMFSPRSNALYAAKFLQELYSETGDWRTAVGRYHSRDGDRAEAYVQRLERLFNTHLAGRATSAPSAPVAERTSAPRQAAQRFSLTSARGPIIMRSSGARPLIGGRP
jgi:hypothetical protein